MSRLKKAHTQSWATWVVVAFLIIASIVGISIAYFSFAKTTITITPEPQDFTATVEVPLNQVDGSIVSTEKSGSLEYTEITAEKQEDDFATGTVTLKNETGADQPLVVTTRLLSEEGILFRIQESTVVPARGEVDVPVKADQPGASGNIDPSHFEIVALHESQKAKIYGISTEPMRGGVKKTGVVTAADIKKAQDQLKEDLITQALADLKTQVEASGKNADHITADSVNVEVVNQTQSAQAGDTVNSITIEMTIRVTTVSFDPVKLQTIVNEQALDLAPEGTEVTGLPSYTDYTYTLASEPTPPDQPLKIKVTVTGSSIITLSSPLLDRSQIVNKDEQDIKTYFSNFEEVKDVQVTFRPFWIKRAPALADHILIQIAEPSSPDNL